MTGEFDVVQIVPDFSLAGAERMVEALSLELHHRGVRVLAVSMFSKQTAITDELQNSGVKIAFLGKRPGFDFSMISKMRSLFKSVSPQVIHTHLYCEEYSLLASSGFSAKHVHTVHNLAEKEVPRRLQVIQYLAFHNHKVIPVAINPVVQHSICKRYCLDPASVPIVFNGIPQYHPSPVKDIPGDPLAFTFLTVGRAMPQKNQISLVRAFVSFHNKNNNTKLLVIGGGELYQNIASEIEKNKACSYIFQLGQKNNVRDYYYVVDAFVLPSLYEGMPMTLIEAMAAGLPVLASNRGGSVDMVKNGVTGYLCGTSDIEIEEGLSHLYRDPRRQEIAECGKSESSKFTATAMADAYEHIYHLK